MPGIEPHQTIVLNTIEEKEHFLEKLKWTREMRELYNIPLVEVNKVQFTLKVRDEEEGKDGAV